MVIWSRFGFVVPIIVIATMVFSQLLVDGIMGGNYYTMHEWPKLVACSFTAAVLLVVGLWMNKPLEQMGVDVESGSETPERGNNSFFFIPVEYWSAIVFIYGIYMALR